jgi:hypothetical protein
LETLDESGSFDEIPTNNEEDEQLKEDLNKTALKSVPKKISILNLKQSEESFYSKTNDDKKFDRIKYTWDLWKRIP